MFKRLAMVGLVVFIVFAAGQVMAESAMEWYQKGNAATLHLKEQVEYYTKAIELAPNWAYPYNNRGVAYFNLGMFEEAVADFDKAIELKPGYKLAIENRAAANFNKKSAAREAWRSSYRDRLASGF